MNECHISCSKLLKLELGIPTKLTSDKEVCIYETGVVHLRVYFYAKQLEKLQTDFCEIFKIYRQWHKNND